jgi:predicted transcriptional regulator
MKLTMSANTEAVDHLLGELEAAIMRIMWARETATVRDVLEALNRDSHSLAYTTVMTVMIRLVTKEILSRELTGKTHRYRVAMSEDQFLRRAAGQRVHALIEEFGDLAISHFLAEIKTLSPKRRQQLEAMVEEEVS